MALSTSSSAQKTITLEEVSARAKALTIDEILDSINHNISSGYAQPACLKTRVNVELSKPDSVYYHLQDSFYLVYLPTYKGHRFESYAFFSPQDRQPLPKVDNTTKKQRMRGVVVPNEIYENPVRNIPRYLERYRGRDASFLFQGSTSDRMVELIWLTENETVWNKESKQKKDTIIVEFLKMTLIRKNWLPIQIQNGAIELSSLQYSQAKQSFQESKKLLEALLDSKQQNQLVVSSVFEINNQGKAQMKHYEIIDNFSPVSYGFRLIGKVPNPEGST